MTFLIEVVTLHPLLQVGGCSLSFNLYGVSPKTLKKEVIMANSLTNFLRLSRDIRLYVCVWGFLSFGYFGVFSVLFNLYLLRIGYGPETIGLFVGAGQLAWVATSLPPLVINLSLTWGLCYQQARLCCFGSIYARAHVAPPRQPSLVLHSRQTDSRISSISRRGRLSGVIADLCTAA